MNKRELVKDMQNFAGSGFITRKKFAEYMGKKEPYRIDKYLVGLDRVGTNYFIPDVADVLLREVTRR